MLASLHKETYLNGKSGTILLCCACERRGAVESFSIHAYSESSESTQTQIDSILDPRPIAPNMVRASCIVHKVCLGVSWCMLQNALCLINIEGQCKAPFVYFELSLRVCSIEKS